MKYSIYLSENRCFISFNVFLRLEFASCYYGTLSWISLYWCGDAVVCGVKFPKPNRETAAIFVERIMVTTVSLVKLGSDVFDTNKCFFHF